MPGTMNLVSKRETETAPRQDESTETEQASGQNESVLKDEMPIEMGSGNDMVWRERTWEDFHETNSTGSG